MTPGGSHLRLLPLSMATFILQFKGLLVVCGFYSASGFGPDDSVIFDISGGRVGLDFLECFASVSCSFFAFIVEPYGILSFYF